MRGSPRYSSTNTSHPLFLAVACVLTGLFAGLGGLLLSILLHCVQHLAYGYSTDHIFGATSFLEGVSASPSGYRVLALSLCGLVAGLGWWFLWRRLRPLVSIHHAIKNGAPAMPTGATLWHVLLQIITVGLGSPLGREVAPRELGALGASHIGRRLGLVNRDVALLISCGAGAGLAAVYNVPLAGALFSLEALAGRLRWHTVIPAVTTSALAAWTASLGLGHAPQYHVIAMPDQAAPSLMLWALLASPALGAGAYLFSLVTEKARARAPRDGRLLLLCGLNFPLIGLMSVIAPAILGNGKPIVQSCLNGSFTLPMLLLVLVFKMAAVWGSLRSGAHGGLLTPGLAMGAMMGTLMGMLWNTVLPSMPLGAFVLVAAPAFLAASMRMPLTALALGIELTRVNPSWLSPMVLAAAGALAVNHLCQRRWGH